MNKFITYAYFRKETDVSSSVEDSKLDNPIKRAHDRLSELLGPIFFAEISAQVATTPKTLSADNLALFDPFVKQYLAWQAYEFYIVKANTYETRAGVRVFKEENSDPVDAKTLGEQIAMAKRDCQFYKEQLINFLRTAQRVAATKYPLYTNKETCMGSGFGITAVSKIDEVRFSIDNSIINNQEP